ncbi:MAG: hypothetical protein E6K53_02015 [Gammaproteobacteria bacterium]|nr:MAG: hypothetical protein E6K53_02015 [Gammaproteobacteria bacterium]
MKICKSILAASIAAALYANVGAFAADTAAPDAADTQNAPSGKPDELGTIVVTGIRESLQKSLETKRNAQTHVEVVTAEDIGKMPDKNVADSLMRIPGVTTSSASANEGGFDENDRVSMRGTNPSLTQTLINGHPVSSGDWFVLNQTGTVGRSVTYTLLPSELVGKVVVHKTAQASDVEGGVAGSVDIQSRKPLDFSKPFTAEATLGGVYAQQPDKTDPQFSGLINWKSDDKTWGVMLQAFSRSCSVMNKSPPTARWPRRIPIWPMCGIQHWSARRCSSRCASAKADSSICSSSRARTSVSTSTRSLPRWTRRTTTATTCCGRRTSSTAARGRRQTRAMSCATAPWSRRILPPIQTRNMVCTTRSHAPTRARIRTTWTSTRISASAMP